MMSKLIAHLMFLFVLIFAFDNAGADWTSISKEKLTESLHVASLSFGAPAFLRIFKEEQVIEVWLKNSDCKWVLFKEYKICAVSGELGPKEKEGDKQAPEGVYYIDKTSFNPNSKYHLSIDIGYPNQFDKLMNRTGGGIVIHGYCASIGCFAINNEGIEELYGLLLGAIRNGQNTVSVHIFPFKQTSIALKSHMGLKEDRQWIIFKRLTDSIKKVHTPTGKHDEYKEYWLNLKLIYDYFEGTNNVPDVNISLNGYMVLEKK